MENIELEIGDIIYIPKLKSIGLIIDKGKDTSVWYRTDCDGVSKRLKRERDELVNINNVKELIKLINEGYTVAPSVVKKIVENYVTKK